MYKYILLFVLPFVIAEYDYDSCSVKCIEQWALSGINNIVFIMLIGIVLLSIIILYFSVKIFGSLNLL